MSDLSRAIAGVVVFAAVAIAVAGAADPDSTHDPALILFLDDAPIERREGLVRRFNRAEPLPTPVIAPDDPATEADCAWGNVIREPDGRFRMWYCTMMMGHAGKGPHEMAAAGVWGRGEDFTFRPRSAADVRPTETMLGRYAESDDGLSWRKPALGLVEFRGRRDTNVILSGAIAAAGSGGALTNFDGWSVLRDDRDPDPARRYKAVAHWESVHCWDNHDVSGSLGRPQQAIDRCWQARGEYLATSPDGLRWDGPLQRIDTLPSGGGDRLVVVPDRRHEGWMAYVRAGGWEFPAFSRSPDLVRWSAAETAPDITPAALGMPAVECVIPFNYGAGDLGFVCGMDKAAGRFTVRLAACHDGGEWHLVDDGEPFIPAGPPGSHHATGAVPLHDEPIVVGERMLVFFNAFARDPEHPCPHGARSIGVATLRRDGFAGLTPASPRAAGTLLTRPLAADGSRLLLNLERRPGDDGRPSGTVTAALLDAAGTEIEGHSFADAVPVVTDGTRMPLGWRGHDRLPRTGREVRLALRIEGNAVVYAVAREP